MLPYFKHGEAVRVIRNIRNDGTYPGLSTGKILVKRGNVGYVQNIGTFLQDQIIYSVHYIDVNMIIGCREEELIRKADNWVMSRFEFRDKVTTNKVLTVKGKVIASPGDVAEILKVLHEPATTDQSEMAKAEFSYHVHFPGHTLQVRESMLEPAQETSN